MRVLVAHNFYQQPGGEDIVFEAEKSLLRNRQHEVVEYVEHNNRIENLGKLELLGKTMWSRETSARISQTLKVERPAVAHFHNTFPLISPSAYYSCRSNGIPVVQTLHNYRLQCVSATFYRDRQVCESCAGRTVAWQGVVHGCYRGSRAQSAVVAGMVGVHRMLKTWNDLVDVYIVLSEFARQKMMAGGLPAEKIVVKPNFLLSEPQWTHEPAGKFGLYAGRFSPEKGVLTLERALRKCAGVPFKLAGDGPLLSEQSVFPKDKKLSNVDVLGRVSSSRINELMSNAAFVVVPSECFEGFPMTIVESFACRLPVIAPNLGSMTEIIDDGRTGLHFRAGDAADLASKISWAWNNKEAMQEMGANARQEFESRYTADINYELLMAAYRKAIQAGS